jgi:hypothetical protein
MTESAFNAQSNDNHVPDAEAGADTAVGSPFTGVEARRQRKLTDGSDKQEKPTPPPRSCDQGDTEIAWRLLDVLDVLARRSPARLEGEERRRIKDGLVAVRIPMMSPRHSGPMSPIVPI